MTGANGRSCVFCGGSPVTGEHVWPQWIAKYLPAERATLYRVVELPGEEANIEALGSDRLPFTTEVRCVCEPCNTGWMHELEATAEPLLAPLIEGKTTNSSGNPWRWREWRQSVAATWATKTLLMLEEVQPEHRAIPREFATLFRRNLRPHPQEQIWLAHYTGKQPHGYYHGPLAFIDRAQPDQRPVSTGYAATIAVGHLVFRLFGHWIRTDGPVSVPEGDVARALSQIHPLVPCAEWPPPLSVDDDGLPHTHALNAEPVASPQHFRATPSRIKTPGSSEE